MDLKKAQLKKLVRKILSDLDSEVSLPEEVDSISVVFAGDELLQQLNESWRGKGKTTDVLSFPLWGGESPSRSLGEVYINVPQAKRQCAEFGTTPHQEIVRLLIHGTLHLLGFDHEDSSRPELREEMERHEDRLFAGCVELLRAE